MIEFDLEKCSLEIKTKSMLGNRNMVDVWFYSSQEDLAGGISFDYPSFDFHFWPLYYILRCKSWTDFPTILPSAMDKVWKITLTRTSGIRIVVDCNDKEVLNIPTSDLTCIDSTWIKEGAKIQFSLSDKSSEY